MIPDIITEYIYIKCDDDYQFKQANEYLESIGISYYNPEDPNPSEREKEYNSMIYITQVKRVLYRIHYDFSEDFMNDDTEHSWSSIKQIVGYIDVNIDDIISNLDKLEDKYK